MLSPRQPTTTNRKGTMEYVYAALCFIFGLVNLRLVRDEIKNGETKFHMAFLQVRKAEDPKKFTWIIVGQCVLSFVMFLVGMYWVNPQ